MGKRLRLLVILLLTAGLAGCDEARAPGSYTSSDTAALAPADATDLTSGNTGGEHPDQVPGELITLKFFTALADRANGSGKVEQDIIDAYMMSHPNVQIDVEALQDEPYKTKIKVYASSNQLPDIIQAWGQPSFLNPLLSNNLLLELDRAEFEDDGFVTSSIEGFSRDGKLYGLPRSADFMVMYYNKQIFAENGITVPKTTADLLDAAVRLRNHGILPVAINGLDGWTLPIWYEFMAQRHNGDFGRMDDAATGTIPFTSPGFTEAAAEMQQFAFAGGFADGWLSTDYGTARNLFVQGQAAMFFMGAWESGLATDENFSREFRSNVGAFAFPASDLGKASDIAAWYGGGYSVSRTSKHPEAAVEFLKYFFAPEHWSKMLWQTGAGTPAQDFDQFLTGNETQLQKELIEIYSAMTSSSGTPLQDIGDEQFKQKVMESHRNLLSGISTPQVFVEELNEAAKQLAGQ
ncbi:ABC transporter substrate-binding protein [Paenibacillus sp. sgz500958]|uniref:ABC transporter substrate-binding protein n=1 Tax=Paenibacillus sp. sgz500958 TaxID=3242475 RepID=UPI0036D42939